MLGRGYSLVIFILGLLCGLSAAQAAPIVNISSELQIAQVRLQSASLTKLKNLNVEWMQQSADCRPTPGFSATQVFVQRILFRLAKGSGLQSHLRTDYGICIHVEPDSQSFFNFGDTPRFQAGVIHVPVEFLRLAHTEDEVAFVIAHEFSHYLMNAEVVEDLNSTPSQIMVEHEADQLAMKLMINAGYDLQSGLALTIHQRDQYEDGIHYDGRDLERLESKLVGEFKTSTLSAQATEIPLDVSGELHPRMTMYPHQTPSAAVISAATQTIQFRSRPNPL